MNHKTSLKKIKIHPTRCYRSTIDPNLQFDFFEEKENRLDASFSALGRMQNWLNKTTYRTSTNKPKTTFI